ncbi:hypothetical protein D6201_07015 [Aurantiacibacter aquimixticola]|uniref:Uncharacterized protein n=1 Tax=Aurantiacibacter aquimixticola TaxID=1958945 RepID=A0A419RTM4_9SPHN|nr:hypothetical protein D6201_07015 [Aurantiacibacter aquimixticola]
MRATPLSANLWQQEKTRPCRLQMIHESLSRSHLNLLQSIPWCRMKVLLHRAIKLATKTRPLNKA